jgi:hypothetical protein
MLKVLWKDPVWAAVIATGITATLGAIGAYLLGYWPAIQSAGATAWTFMLGSTQVSNWVLALLAVPATLVVVLILVLAWGLWSERSETKSTWTTYTSDNFFGLRWRWRYLGDSIDRLVTFCPNCDYQVFPHDASTYNAFNRIAFKCESCGQHIGTFDEPYDHLRSKAERLIQQKLRNNSWGAAR